MTRPNAPLPSPSRRTASQGQVLVIFALAIVGLFGAAGLAFDIGRFYVERRFLQNATDAAALAGANALIRGLSYTAAEDEVRAILAKNLAGDPSGPTATIVTTPVYEPGHAGDPDYLVNGILVSGNEIRVAVQNSVPYTFGKVVGAVASTIGARSLVELRGDLLPTALRHFVNAGGATGTGTYPCTYDERYFQDLLATADTACLGTDTDPSLRVEPSAGLDYSSANPNNDPSHHGPIVTLVGQGAQPANMSSFRGSVVLDIRNFSSLSSNVFYNGVTAGMTANTLKDWEAEWVRTGYPGPNFPPATTPPDPNDQVGLLNGNDTGVIIDTIGDVYQPGDEVLTAVYSGTVMTIPDFTLAPPSVVNIGTTQNRDNQVTMTLDKNAAFSGVVTVTAFADPGDANNVLLTGSLAPLTFSPTPATPKTTVTWTSFRTTGASNRISTIWIQGHSGSPYLTDHYYPVAVNTGSEQRDFAYDGNGLSLNAATTGIDASGVINFSTSNDTTKAFAGNVGLSLEGGPASGGVLPSGIGAFSISPSSFNLNAGNTRAVTITVNGGSLGPGEYPLVIRAQGLNGNARPVTHLIPITLDIATAATQNQYVDLMGFAVFRITAINGTNYVNGYAITPSIADPNDPRLRRALKAQLVPWS